VAEAGPGSQPDRSSALGRVARKRAERRRLVERTAAEVFAERGYEGANFEEIAARLDLRGASLYYYYPSKEDLFLRAVENATTEVLDRLRDVVESDLPHEERLRRLFFEQAIVEIRDYPSFAPLFLMYVPVPAIAERVLELRRQHGSILRTLAVEVAERNGIEHNRAEILAFLAMGSLVSLFSWYDPDGEFGPEEMAHRIADELLRPFIAQT